MIHDYTNQIHQGEVLDRLRELPDSSVHCVVTSPPYFGLRDYGVDGQIGLEGSVEEFVETLVEVGEEIRRVLRDDGNWWLNLGDSFAGSGRGQWTGDEGRPKESYSPDAGQLPDRETHIRRKSKMMVPHRVAIALQDCGWIVRSDAVWSKPNPTPHPVKDRLHEHKEFLFHLTPEPDYWFDLDAVREPHKEVSMERVKYEFHQSEIGTEHAPRETEHARMDKDDALHPNGKNPGDVLEIPVKPFPDAHFAVYPEELVETPIKSSCPPTVCAECGTPYERETVETPLWERDPESVDRPQAQKALERFERSDLTVEHLEAIRSVGLSDAEYGKETLDGAGRNRDEVETLAAESKDVLGGYFREFLSMSNESDGWTQACDCPTVGDYTEPGIVLDPFAGAGTTCLVGKRLGRRFIGFDLNPEYVAMAQKRVGVTVDEPDRLLDENETSLTAFTDGGQRE